MDAYLTFMTEQIAQEIKAIEDPRILHIYLRAIQYQRCRLCGAKEGTCKNGIYQSYHCRQLNEMVESEKWILEEDED
jgi:heterodisulfide reductase subunit C